MHSSRMRTAHSLPYMGGLPDRDPQTETPLDRDPPPPGQRPLRQRPPWTKTPWTETESPCEQTNTCENITFAKFGDGKYR